MIHRPSRGYWTSWKNVYDNMKILVGAIYFISCFGDSQPFHTKLYFDDDDSQNYRISDIQSLSLSILMFLQWSGLTEHLRIVGRFRIFIEVIKQTIKDAMPFLVLVIIALFAVHDFLYFKKFSVTGKTRDDNYRKMIG